MAGDKKIDQVEKQKRIRIIMDWILEDWYAGDIISKAADKWKISERQAKRYLSEARKRWTVKDQDTVEPKRRLKIETLRKLKRSLKRNYQGTPFGIRALLSVEKEITKLEGLYPATKIAVEGKDGEPLFPKADLSRFSKEELQLIVELSKKAIIET